MLAASNSDRGPCSSLDADVDGGLDLTDHPNVRAARVTPLSTGAAASFAPATVQGEALPPRVIDDLVARSGGNPLFLQELLNAGPAR